MPMIAIMAPGLSTAWGAHCSPTSLSSPQDAGRLPPGVDVWTLKPSPSALDVRALKPIHPQAARSSLCTSGPASNAHPEQHAPAQGVLTKPHEGQTKAMQKKKKKRGGEKAGRGKGEGLCLHPIPCFLTIFASFRLCLDPSAKVLIHILKLLGEIVDTLPGVHVATKV